ncbi:hypothetical protein CALCODRAFT_77767 [Calocera cornea HHB12733]|uniref:Ribonuclease H1 N-terminal domain-containing protein n=1 Tax=Calocera cornea HHB12733 TaxID=1353952 RepID=A0A165DGR6_9BASI|nr:hypothetical protein CALCODRAFT_77767 [Calocera cornea HHB12733]
MGSVESLALVRFARHKRCARCIFDGGPSTFRYRRGTLKEARTKLSPKVDFHSTVICTGQNLYHRKTVSARMTVMLNAFDSGVTGPSSPRFALSASPSLQVSGCRYTYTMPRAYFYAVRVGRGGPFVYSTWEDCERATKGLSRARYKKFDNYPDAERWMRDTSPGANLQAGPILSRQPNNVIPASSLLPVPFHSSTFSPTERSHTHTHEVIYLLDSSSDIEEVPGPDALELLSDSDPDSEPPLPVHSQGFPESVRAEAALVAEGPLSPEQEHIFDLVVRQHKSVFFTGSAG